MVRQVSATFRFDDRHKTWNEVVALLGWPLCSRLLSFDGEIVYIHTEIEF